MKKPALALTAIGMLALCAIWAVRAWSGPVRIVFQADGICSMCEFRITGAAREVPGVHNAEWDYQTKLLTLSVDRSLADNQRPIQEAIAEQGHDTPLKKAADEVYDSLPGCCRYRVVQ